MITLTSPQIDWRARTTSVQPHELSPAMLAPIQRDADACGLPQTVWPSRFYGPAFVGIDCLLLSAAAVLDHRPHDTADWVTAGLPTVLPTYWFTPGGAA